METGEFITEVDMKDTKATKRITKAMIDKMLEEANVENEIDSNMLYGWCKIIGDINGYGQIRLNGAFRDIEFEKKMAEDITITGYTIRIFHAAHPFSGLLKGENGFLTTWTDLWATIACTGRGNQIKLKRFLQENDLVREFKVGGRDGKLVKRLIVNPFLMRGASHTSQVSMMAFQDCIKEGVNAPIYPIRWLQSLGYINK